MLPLYAVRRRRRHGTTRRRQSHGSPACGRRRESYACGLHRPKRGPPSTRSGPGASSNCQFFFASLRVAGRVGRSQSGSTARNFHFHPGSLHLQMTDVAAAYSRLQSAPDIYGATYMMCSMQRCWRDRRTRANLNFTSDTTQSSSPAAVTRGSRWRHRNGPTATYTALLTLQFDNTTPRPPPRCPMPRLPGCKWSPTNPDRSTPPAPGTLPPMPAALCG